MKVQVFQSYEDLSRKAEAAAHNPCREVDRAVELLRRDGNADLELHRICQQPQRPSPRAVGRLSARLRLEGAEHLRTERRRRAVGLKRRGN